ncbi:MAG: AAA family ATPase [Chloroflexi bacterium]|nr:AAA family ATPase [Ardenticatenaceae bacterium]MBL1130078.1 4-phytase [Chloroflexota bacterium]NOG36164.1 AAA family ATPase [Chloroflexota bacterium]GIK54885.1 MAG: 4-phytase [Chloroflexota bacterium]
MRDNMKGNGRFVNQQHLVIPRSFATVTPMTADLIASIAAYISHDRVNHILTGAPLADDGVALIADISGFTPLTEALTQGLQADHGAEELTRALDSVFTPLIAQIHRYRGSVIKFGGDALIVWFGRAKGGRCTAVIHRALTAAHRMQRVMQQHGRIPTPIGPVTLRMKIGLTYGPVKRFNLGLPAYGFEDVLAGATLDRMADNEHHAEPGDIMADAATLQMVGDVVTVQAWREGVAVVGKLRRAARPQPWPTGGTGGTVWRPATAEETAADLVAELAAYVPRAIVETLQAGQTQVAELKPVVSLFVQFHGLDYDADPDIAAKLQRYFSLAQEIVGRYDGRLNRLITGDKGSLLHIIFGAPRSVEEQEERAIRCALDLQAECGRLPFITRQRIGISGGRVFAGPVGSPHRHDYTTMGDAINLSARLMQNAADDQILLDTAVRSQLSPALQVTDLGLIQVKGKTAPIHIYAATAYEPPTRQSRRIERLFGRDEELAVIRDALSVIRLRLTDYSSQITAHDSRLTVHGGILAIIGGVGQGKTLLLDNVRTETEATWQSDRTGGIWASGISLAYGHTITGYLFIELLRDLLNLPPAATPHQTSQRLRDFCAELFGAARLESVYPYLAAFMNLPLPDEVAARLEGLAGESRRWQLFELIPDLLRQLCRHYPVVLVLDDVQWADPTSLQLVERIAPLTAELPLLLLLALRPETETRAWEMVQGWDTAVLPLTRLTLAPLSDAAAAALITTQAPHLPPPVVDYLVAKGGGNPLFLVELVRTLQLTGAADLAHIELDALDLPNSVQGLLLAQLDRLAVETRHTLQLAAVIGKTFLDQVLARISTAEQQVDSLLAELEGQDYIRPDQTDLGAAHSFRHALIQEGAYSTLLHERRRAYHRQVAEAFEQLFPAAITEQVAFLAYHWEQAEALDKAIYYLSLTADQSRLLYAHEEAELLYGRILTLLSQLPPDTGMQDRQARTYLKLAQVKVNDLDFDGAQRYYEQAFDLLEQVSGPAADEQKMVTAVPTFRWGVLPEFAHDLDPAHVETSDALQLIINLFEGLVELDNEWNVIPLLARRWQVLDGGRRYRFELRRDWRWSDGIPVTAHDFVFAWRRNLSPQTNAGMAHQLYTVRGAAAFHRGEVTQVTAVGITALDDWTLEIELDAPINYFLYLLAYPVTLPQPAHHVTMHLEEWATPRHLVCNGPFQPDGDVHEYSLHLKQNPHYRGLRTGNISQVSLQFQQPTWQQYQQNQVDWCRVDDRTDLPTLFPESAFLVQGFVTFFLGFACHTPPFDNKLVRQSFARAIDRQTLVQTVWAGVQKPASGGFVPPGMPGHSPEIGLPFDPEQARFLLQQAGFAGGHGLPPLKLLALPGFAGTPAYLQQAWQTHLNISVEIVDSLTDEEFIAHLAQGKGHLALLGCYAAYPDPDDVLRDFFYSRSPNNLINWQSSWFDALLDQAQRITRAQQRFDLYHEADRVLVQTETAVAPLYYLQAYGLLRPPFHFADTGRIIRDGNIKFKNIVV